MRNQFVVSIDGTSHLLGEDETTTCGIVVPHGTPFTREPEGKLCPVCFPEEAKPEVESKPKAKPKAKKK